MEALSVRSSNLFTVRAANEFEVENTDLTQIGIKRNRLPLDFHYPIVDGAVFVLDSQAKVDEWRNALGNTAHNSVALVVTTQQPENLSVDQIKALQTALDPSVGNLDELMAEDVDLANELNRLNDSIGANIAIIVPEFQKKIVSNPDAKKAIYGLGLFGANEADNAESWKPTITNDNVRALEYTGFSTIKGTLGPWDSATEKSLDEIEFVKLAALFRGNPVIYRHPAIKTTYDRIALKYANKATPAVDAIKDNLEHCARFDHVRVRAYEWLNNATGNEIIIANNRQLVVKMLGWYLLSCAQIDNSEGLGQHIFAATRLTMMHLGVFVDTTEATAMTLNSPYIVTELQLRNAKRLLKNREVFQICVLTALHSFLKSGHHATAANLKNIFVKLLGSLNLAVPDAELDTYLNYGVYYGSHAGSMRIINYYFRRTTILEGVAASVAYRVSVIPPGAVAYTNLEIYVDALHETGFFKDLNQEARYVQFKDCMQTIRKTMWYSAPYSNYMYGRSTQGASNEKQFCASFAPYAQALNTIMPNSTLRLSPSLMKLISQASANSIEANLKVEAYVAAYRRFYSAQVTKKMQAELGVPLLP